MDKKLEEIYYDPTKVGSFGGVSALSKDFKNARLANFSRNIHAS